jgi:hypothetical protein
MPSGRCLQVASASDVRGKLHTFYAVPRATWYHGSMRQLLLSFCILACWPTYADIEVAFPTAPKPKGATKTAVIQLLPTDDPPEPVRIDGLVVFFSGAHYNGGETQKSESFDKLKEGMTLKEIVSLLGPGSQRLSEK